MLFYRIFQIYGLSREALLACVGAAIAIVVALVSHEVCHGLVALLNGDPTAKLSGRLSLNPDVHFDPFGLLLMLLVGFGYARPVPVNPYNYKNRRLGDVTVSLAGVTANMLLAFFNALFLVLTMQYGWNVEQNTAAYYVVIFLQFLFTYSVSINISFALFNILPIFPLDGYRFIASFVDEDSNFMRGLRNASRYIVLAIIVLDWVFDLVPGLQIYSPLYWYFNVCGGAIERGFIYMWGLLF